MFGKSTRLKKKKTLEMKQKDALLQGRLDVQKSRPWLMLKD